MKMVIKYILSHHNNISKRPQSDKHRIKLDAVLENSKFVNKGEKDPIYEMEIPKDMMSDEIKAFADYVNYLAKPIRTQPGNSRGKGLITKKGIEDVIQKKETAKIPRKKHTKTDQMMTRDSCKQMIRKLKRRHKKDKDEKVGEVQTKVRVPEKRIKKPIIPPPSSSLTLLSAEYGNQFLNDNADMSLNELLKEPVDAKVQSMVDVPIHKENPAVQATPIVDTVITIKSSSFLEHEKHLELFNALTNSMGVDEPIAKGDLGHIPKLKKRHHDDQDPPTNSKKEKKKKRRKDTNASKSQKDNTPAKSSKEGK
nr:hypothetical protein [Tanacetum cinerariifolium]